MSENELLENVIRQWGWKIMKRLGLPLIKIEFSLTHPNCAFTRENSLLFGLEFLKRFRDKNTYPKVVPPTEFFDRIYLIVAHETAHYLQEHRHFKWYEKYNRERIENEIDTDSHIKQKLERNASKIAGILLKEHKLFQNKT